MKRVAAALCLGILASCGSDAAEPSDADIREQIIEESWVGIPGKCPCPYMLLNSGKKCGDNSAYRKKGGGARPKCFPRDVSDAQVRQYREAHPAKAAK